jgi:hypothetical protein
MAKDEGLFKLRGIPAMLEGVGIADGSPTYTDFTDQNKLCPPIAQRTQIIKTKNKTL